MNSSQLSMSSELVELLIPTQIVYLLFSRNFATSGEKSESPVTSANTPMCGLVCASSSASTTILMSALFLPLSLRPGISISSTPASCSGRLYLS